MTEEVSGRLTGSRASTEPVPVSALSGFDPEREEALKSIAGVIEHWIDWVTHVRTAEGMETSCDTHVLLQGENAPPYWPTVGQLRRWVEVLRGWGDGTQR